MIENTLMCTQIECTAAPSSHMETQLPSIEDNVPSDSSPSASSANTSPVNTSPGNTYPGESKRDAIMRCIEQATSFAPTINASVAIADDESKLKYCAALSHGSVLW